MLHALFYFCTQSACKLTHVAYRGTGENYLMRILIFFVPQPILCGYKIEKNEMGGACSAYGGGERRVQGFGGETGGKETTGETQA